MVTRQRFSHDGGIAELHINFDKHQLTDNELHILLNRSEILPGGGMVLAGRICGVKKEVGIGSPHSELRRMMASASARKSAGSVKNSPPTSTTGKTQD